MSEIRLVQTCGACPEQYDAYLGDKLVGYLRLRHGYFTTQLFGPDGEYVYEADTIGDGCFEADEYDFHVDNAKRAILQRLGFAADADNSGGLTPEQVADLIERLEKADTELKGIIREQMLNTGNAGMGYMRTVTRLEGKVEGVRLALSYLREYL